MDVLPSVDHVGMQSPPLNYGVMLFLRLYASGIPLYAEQYAVKNNCCHHPTKADYRCLVSGPPEITCKEEYRQDQNDVRC